MKSLGMRFCAVLMAVVLAASMGLVALAANFTDVPADHWAYRYIQDAQSKSVLNGYPDGTFRPNGTLTVAHCLQAFYNAAKAKNPAVETTYGGDTSTWYAPAAAYFKGRTNMEYADPANTPANRSSICYMIYLLERNGATASRDLRFTDCNSIPDSEKEAINFCYSHGIIDGYSDGTFRPYGNLTRAHAAKIVMNWYYRFSETTAAPSTATPSGTGTATPAPSTSGTTTATPAPSATTTTTPSTTTPAPSGTSGTGTGTNPGANRGDTPAAPTQSGGGASNPPAAPAAQPLTATQAIELAESLGLVTEDFVWENDRTLTGLRVYSRATVDDLESYLFAVKNDGSAWWTQNNAASASMESIALVDVRTWFQNLASQLSNTQKTAIAGYYLVDFAVRQGLYATYDGGTNVIVRTSASANTTYTVNNGVVSGGGLAAARTAIRNAASTLGNNRAETVARAIGAYAEAHGGWTVTVSTYNSDGAWQAVCRKSTTTPGTDSTTTTTREIIVVTTVSDSGLHVWVPNGGTLAEYSLGGTLEVIAAG